MHGEEHYEKQLRTWKDLNWYLMSLEKHSIYNQLAIIQWLIDFEKKTKNRVSFLRRLIHRQSKLRREHELKQIQNTKSNDN